MAAAHRTCRSATSERARRGKAGVAWHALPVRLDIVVAQLLDTIARLRCRERPDGHGADFALLGRFARHSPQFTQFTGATSGATDSLEDPVKRPLPVHESLSASLHTPCVTSPPWALCCEKARGSPGPWIRMQSRALPRQDVAVTRVNPLRWLFFSRCATTLGSSMRTGSQPKALNCSYLTSHDKDVNICDMSVTFLSTVGGTVGGITLTAILAFQW